MCFSFCRLLSQDLNRRVNEDTCKDGDSDAYKCVYVIVQSRRKKKKHVPLTQKETAHAYSSVVEFQRLKIGCFKTAVLKNAWPCDRCILSFSNELLVLWSFCLSFTPRGERRIKIAVTQIMKRYYRKQCILRHHDINNILFISSIRYISSYRTALHWMGLHCWFVQDTSAGNMIQRQKRWTAMIKSSLTLSW